MSLRDKLGQQATSLSMVGGGDSMASASYNKLRTDTHKALLDRVDLEVMSKMSSERLKEELRMVIDVLLAEAGAALNSQERRQMVTDIQNEVMGHGPIEPLLHDPTVSDILINGSQSIFVERAGRIEPTDLKFDDDAHLMRIIDKIVSRVGRRIDESSPMVDARLPDGSRVNAIIPPLAIDGPSMSIRRFAVIPLKMDDLIARQSVPAVFAELLSAMVKAKLNILISGGTGSGKTTMLNVLSGFIPEQERIITIEDAAELQLQQAHVIRLETRPANIEGKGEISQRALVRNSLRMRPDRIVLGEVRAGEAFDMLQAMNTGHEGSMATVHANTPRDALSRLENMLGMAGLNLPPKAMRQQIASAITAVVQLSRLTDGQRKLMSISEVTGMEGDIVTMQEIFSFQQTGVGERGEVLGHFKASGVRPRFIDRVRSFGIKLPEQMFDPSKSYKL
jgi:pilus assembly protein CpaF